jgi:NTE family protein
VDPGPIAVVLAGGGARGAYALGVLSVVLPALRDRDESPAIYVGSSIGAVQVAYLAARAADPLDRVLDDGLTLWRKMGLRQFLSPPLSLRQLCLLMRYSATAAGLPVSPPPSFVAAKPMKRAVEGIADFDEIEANVRSGKLAAVAVVATSSSTGRSVVFHNGRGRPVCDRARGIDYFPTRVTAEHIWAATAIPSLFPAVHVSEPEHASGWYVDGGTRLNAPIKPALALGAKRLVIVGLNSNRPSPAWESARRPDAIDGAGHLTQAILADPLYNDVQTLARLNAVARDGGEAVPYEEIPYIFVAPDHRERIGQVAAEVFEEHYTGLRHFSSRRLRLLGRLLDARSSAQHGELLSYLFFAKEFVDALVELGQDDAAAWLKESHDRGPWRLRPPP